MWSSLQLAFDSFAWCSSFEPNCDVVFWGRGLGGWGWGEESEGGEGGQQRSIVKEGIDTKFGSTCDAILCVCKDIHGAIAFPEHRKDSAMVDVLAIRSKPRLTQHACLRHLFFALCSCLSASEIFVLPLSASQYQLRR